MPAEGVKLTPRPQLMTAEEVFEIANTFVKKGVDKIRLTGGEPLVRKDFSKILNSLTSLPVDLSLTTNGIIVDKYLKELITAGVKKVNISIDSLHQDKFQSITRFNKLDKVLQNIDLLIKHNFEVKLNVVLIKGFNDDEITDLISFAKDRPVSVRFIEFMPFDGNLWQSDKVVSEAFILERAKNHFGSHHVLRTLDATNDTSHNYRIEGFVGSFGIISTVTNPFCDSCNRIRLTANGKIKNCLFSQDELDLLTALRKNEDISSLIDSAFLGKNQSRGGYDNDNSFLNATSHVNRSMILIGG